MSREGAFVKQLETQIPLILLSDGQGILTTRRPYSVQGHNLWHIGEYVLAHDNWETVFPSPRLGTQTKGKGSGSSLLC